MKEITLSMTETVIGSLQELFRKYELEHRVRVHVDPIPVSGGWSHIVGKAIYHSGLDVAVVGNSWVGDLVQMNALRPFKNWEVNKITQGKCYFDSVWRNSIRIESGVQLIYSVPWLADSRAVFYRRDLLQQAGVDGKTAFIDPTHFEQTLETLKEKGISIPLALPTRRSRNTIHYLASWIWGAGGDFIEQEGKKTHLIFDQPKTLEACNAYFCLGRYLGAEGRLCDEHQSQEAFTSGKAAVTLGGSWILNALSPKVHENLGTSPIPGVPFVGGDDLVMWKHSLHKDTALQLIDFLHTEEAGKLLYPKNGLPVSENDWSQSSLDSDACRVFKLSIERGRGFPNIRLWGLVEKHLTDAFAEIWAKVLQDPDSPPDAIVETRLVALARRLRMILEL